MVVHLAKRMAMPMEVEPAPYDIGFEQCSIMLGTGPGSNICRTRSSAHGRARTTTAQWHAIRTASSGSNAKILPASLKLAPFSSIVAVVANE